MKKGMALLLICALCMPLCALAQEEAPAAVTANAVAQCENVYDVLAPFSGVLTSFDWDNGDMVNSGDTLFALDTVKVYAPVDGTVRAVFAEAGDLCEDVVGQYGMIACMERELPQIADCSTSGAYNDDDNRLIHVGERVFFYQSNDKDNEGEGRVTAVDGSKYPLEVTAGAFVLDDGIKIYRDEKMGTKSCIGSGTIHRAVDVPIAGSGRVLRCAVSEGQRVSKSQLLFELSAPDAEVGVESASITAPRTGALELVSAVSGQKVYKGQLLAKVHDLSAMSVVAEVDEMDLSRVQVGDSLTVVFDRYPGEEIAGTVQSIARIGKSKQNATYYDVTIGIGAALEVLPGMNATAWLPAER